MKTIKLIAVAVLVAASSFAFAENYTVKAVKGTVKAGTVKVEAGQTLSDSTKLTAGLNSQLTLSDQSGKTIVIKGKSTGTLADLAAKSSGLKKGKLSVTTVASAAKGGSNGVATASSRASEAKEDTEWVE